MCAAYFTNVDKRLIFRPGGAVGPIAREGIVDVHDGEDTCLEWNLFPFETIRITSSVPFFVVVMRDVQCGLQESNAREKVVGMHRMLVHDHPLFIGQLIRL